MKFQVVGCSKHLSIPYHSEIAKQRYQKSIRKPLKKRIKYIPLPRLRTPERKRRRKSHPLKLGWLKKEELELKYLNLPFQKVKELLNVSTMTLLNHLKRVTGQKHWPKNSKFYNLKSQLTKEKIEFFLKNKTQKEVCKELHTSVPTLMKYIDLVMGRHVIWTRHNSKFKLKHLNKVNIQMYLKMNQKQVANQLGVSVRTLQQKYKSMGLKNWRGQRKLDHINQLTILPYLNTGKSQLEIARCLNVSLSSLQKKFRQLNMGKWPKKKKKKQRLL